MAMHDVEVWLMVDDDGDYVVAVDESTLGERWADEIGGFCGARVVKIALKVEVPTPTVVSATVPYTGQATEVKIIEG